MIAATMSDYPLLVIPGEKPESWNRILRMHWKKRSELVQQYKGTVAQLIPHEVGMFTDVVDIALVAYFPNLHLVKDNCNLPVKLYIDGLLGRVIQDDSPTYVRSVTEVSRMDRENPRLEIYVKPAQAYIVWDI